ncbi:MAG TPA: ornithine cyclodeaminase family protein [Chloroflexota bacterium]|nr:ornithine cyclodeaminase family protein [Chloroflexota bacterium]
MSAIYLRDSDLEPLVSYADAIALVEEALKSLAKTDTSNRPRQRVRAGKSGLNVLVAACGGYVGFKAYSGGPGSPGMLNWLYEAEDGSLVAMLQSNWLSLARTSAASAVATRALAKPDAKVAAFLGAGRQARGQLQAVCLVRNFADVRCYSPSGVSAEDLAKLARRLGLNARACKSAEEAVASADVVTVATRGTEIALQGRWLMPGTHVNAMGVNRGSDREIDAETVLRAGVIAVDEKENARTEAGDLIPVVQGGQMSWDRVHDLGAILNGDAPGRQSAEDITLFESQGLGIEDIAVSAVAYERAMAKGIGHKLPF